MYLLKALSLEILFVLFFFWRSFLEPDEVRFYPQTLLIVMALCALTSIYYAWKLRNQSGNPVNENRANKLISIGLFFLYLLAFNKLGFLLASSLFYFLWLTAMERRFALKNVVIPVLFVGLIYYVFHDVLGVLLPDGYLESLLGLAS